MNKDMITKDNCEGWLMRYADGALSPEERIAVEEFLAAHPEMKEEMDEVAAVKVTPVVAAMPGKELMMKNEGGSFAWWRAAAAVLLLLLTSTTLLLLTRQPPEGPVLAGVVTPVAHESETETMAEEQPVSPVAPTPVRPIRTIPPADIQHVPTEEPVLAEEVSTDPCQAQEEMPSTEDSMVSVPLPEPSVSVATVVENARLAINPWLEPLTAKN